jgi:hypothetical protein
MHHGVVGAAVLRSLCLGGRTNSVLPLVSRSSLASVSVPPPPSRPTQVYVIPPNDRSSVNVTGAGTSVHVTSTGTIELDIASLSWPSDSYVYQNAEWFDEELTYEHCILGGPGVGNCTEGRRPQFKYVYVDGLTHTTNASPHCFDGFADWLLWVRVSRTRDYHRPLRTALTRFTD